MRASISSKVYTPRCVLKRAEGVKICPTKIYNHSQSRSSRCDVQRTRPYFQSQWDTHLTYEMQRCFGLEAFVLIKSVWNAVFSRVFIVILLQWTHDAHCRRATTILIGQRCSFSPYFWCIFGKECGVRVVFLERVTLGVLPCRQFSPTSWTSRPRSLAFCSEYACLWASVAEGMQSLDLMHETKGKPIRVYIPGEHYRKTESLRPLLRQRGRYYFLKLVW